MCFQMCVNGWCSRERERERIASEREREIANLQRQVPTVVEPTELTWCVVMSHLWEGRVERGLRSSYDDCRVRVSNIALAQIYLVPSLFIRVCLSVDAVR